MAEAATGRARWGLPHIALDIIGRILNPHFFSLIASYDVASIKFQALAREWRPEHCWSKGAWGAVRRWRGRWSRRRTT